jgi:lysophospholipase L1-like esterase
MAKRTKAELKAKADAIIKKNGNRKITPEKHNSLETDEIDSFVSAADGGFVVDQAIGYSTNVEITDERQFASKKYVDDKPGGSFDPDADYTFNGEVEFTQSLKVTDGIEDDEAVSVGQLNEAIGGIDLTSKQNTSEKNQPDGYAGLDGSGKVASAQLPSYVDDVVEVANFAALPGTGETGKIYITLDNNKVYRWSGSAYVEIVASPGSTDSVPEGSVNKYFTEARVRDTPLTGFVAGSNTPITAANTVKEGFQNAQGQLNALAAKTGTPLQTETIAYVNKVLAKPNTYLDGAVINAIDKFFVDGKVNGWLSQTKWAWCPLSNTLDGALINLIVTSGVPDELTNNNFVSGDYSQTDGFGTGTTLNSTKFLSTGITPSTLGLNARNISLGAHFVSDAGSNFTRILGVNPVGVASPVQIAQGPSIWNGTLGSLATFPNCVIQASYASQTAYHGAINGVVTIDSTGANITAGVLDTELTVFKFSYTSGTTVYGGGKVGFVYIGSPMTSAQTEAMGRAILDLMAVVGRVNVLGGRMIFSGDSIMQGVGATTGSNRGSTVLCSLLGVQEYNVAQSSAQLRQSVSSAGNANGILGGYINYPNIASIKANTVVLGWGTNDMFTADATTNGDSTIISDYQTKLALVIDGYKAKNTRVVDSSVMWNSTSNATKRGAYALAAYNAANSRNVLFLDANSLFSDYATPSTNFSDGLHPNNAGHAIWANAMNALLRGRAFRYLSLDFPSIAANSYQDLTVTVYGAKVGMQAILAPPSTITDGISYAATVTATNTVTVRAINSTGSAVDLAAAFYRVTVLLDN